MNKLTLLCLIQATVVTFGYEMRCPVAVEWRLRARLFYCGRNYVCLFRSPENEYHETCDGLDYSSIGSKLIFEPYFNKADCSYNRYQPFPFSTEGNSYCVYQKSVCTEEGQFVFHEGSFKSDITCGCDYSKGYTFSTKSRHNCYCIPSEEDCSCHKHTCDHTKCLHENVPQINTTCLELMNKLSPENDKPAPSQGNGLTITKHSIDNGRRDRVYRRRCIYSIVVLLIILIAVIPLYTLIAYQTLPVITKQTEKIDLRNIGTNMELSCMIASTNCSIHTTWFKDDKQITIEPDQTRINLTNQSTSSKLTIKRVKESDVGVYHCTVENATGKTKSEPIHVVYELPVITVITSTLVEITQYEGTVEFQCSIKSELDLQSIEWFKGRKKIYSENQIDNGVPVSSKYCIKKINATDIGDYFCEAENAKGLTRSKAMHLVYVIPEITVENEKIEIPAAGGKIELSCSIKTAYLPISTEWLTGEPLQVISPNDLENKGLKKEDTDTSSKLTFYKAQQNDAGIYICEVENPKGRAKSKPVTVVSSLPVISGKRKRIEIPPFERSIELIYAIKSEYPILSTKWQKNKKPIDPNDTRYTSQMEDNKSTKLTICNIQKSDVGTYECLVSNKNGRTKSDPMMIVCVLPMITVKQHRIGIPSLEENKEFICEIGSDDPNISCMWFKNEKLINSDKKYKIKLLEDKKSTILRIRRIDMSDVGTYECEVTNGKGSTRSGPMVIESDIIDILICRQVFTTEEAEKLNNLPTQKDRNRMLLSVLLNGDKQMYNKFVEALNEDEKYQNLANVIMTTSVTNEDRFKFQNCNYEH